MTDKPTLKKYGFILKQSGFTVTPTESDANKNETIIIAASELLEALKMLKEKESCAFDFLVSVLGTDKPAENAIEMVYHLYSTVSNETVIVKATLNRATPEIDSVVSLWITADWHEREVFDLLGVNFIGHPNLKRILLPDGWKGHPLRKDYVQDDERLAWNER